MRQIIIIAFAIFAIVPSSLLAQNKLEKTFQVERFEIDPVLPRNIWHVTRNNILPHLSPSGTMSGHFAVGQLQIVNQGNAQDLLAEKVQGEIALALGLFDWMELGIALPIVFYQVGDLTGFGQDPTEKDTRITTIGDIRMVPKLMLIRPEWAGGFAFGLAANIYFPISKGENFESDGNFRVNPKFVLDYSHVSGFAIAINAGHDFRQEHGVLGFTDNSNIRFGVGLEIPTFWKPLSVIGNFYGDLDIKSPQFGKREDEPMEFMAGFQLDLPENVSLALGGGGGLNRAVGSPKYRVFAAMGYAPGARDRDGDGILDDDDRCPLRREDFDGDRDFDGCPDEDSDNDGIEDDDDDCPNQAEDLDHFEDKDGCPDYDNDKDGLVDTADKCPNVAGLAKYDGCPVNDADGDGIVDQDDKCPNDPEDKDGFDDEDGCPDLDDDFDGVPDKKDKCKMLPEDQDGFQDSDGCPDEDNDADGIKDVDDRCPNDAETFNSFEDEDGCPDTKKSRVKVGRDKITITEKINFDTGSDKIKSRSFSILRDLAKVMKENSKIKKIRIEGHTDSRGSSDKNEELSQRRADAVLAFLVGEGVKSSRLVARGYGEERPIASNSSSRGREQNRRVEFTILK